MQLTTRLALAVLLVLAATSCGDDTAAPAPVTSSTTSTTTTTTTAPTSITPPPQSADPIVVLITNDDGVGAPGIDALVEALRAQPELELVVVAPAENQSGSGDKTTPSGTPEAVEAQTASGFPAHAVNGFPADAVDAAFDQLAVDPDLVIAGVNAGQNVGLIADVSGTVGAARTAARRGVPAIAVSAGLADEIDYAAAVAQLLDVLDARLDNLLEGPPTVLDLNVPSCTTGMVRGLVDVPLQTVDRGQGYQPDCTSTAGPDFVDDTDAFVNGYATVADAGF